MSETATTNGNPTPTLEERITALGGIDKVEHDLTYLHTIIFAITDASLKNVQISTEMTADEVQTMFLSIGEVDDKVGDADLTAILFVNGCKARIRSIEYSRNNKVNKIKAESQAKYNRWASANPKLAVNPLTNLPVMLAYGLLSEELYKEMMSEAKAAFAAAASATSAAL
jgi:hypothetical protein